MNLDVNAIFEEELAKRGVAFTREGDDRYRVARGVIAISVSLENVRRDAERDRDPDAVRRFVTRVLHAGDGLDLSWNEASGRLRLSAEPSDQDFGDTIQTPVTERVCRVLTLTDPDEGLVTWVDGATCASWGVTPDEAIAAALRNQDALIDGLRLEVEEIEGHKLGMVPLDSPFKASVIFAPSFERLVAADFGWPVWVVIPCRDFIYVIAERSALVPRLGAVVLREFQDSGYPITTEVLRVASDGIEAIGAFAQPATPESDV